MINFWEVVSKLNWDGDYKRCERYLVKNFSKQETKQLRSFADVLMKDLNTKFEQDWLDRIPVSDDGWSDLRAEVIGRGKEFYDSITVEKLVEMAENNDYTESFIYIFPYNYEDLQAIIDAEDNKKSAEEIAEDVDYLFSKINWGSSFLDAKAVQIMNSLKSDIKKLK